MKQIIFLVLSLTIVNAIENNLEQTHREYYYDEVKSKDSDILKELEVAKGKSSTVTRYDKSGIVRQVSHYSEILLEDNFSKDLQDGSHKLFYKSGALMISELWYEGTPRGILSLYYESRKIQMELYIKDKLDESEEELVLSEYYDAIYLYKENGTKMEVKDVEKRSMLIEWYYFKREKSFWETLDGG